MAFAPKDLSVLAYANGFTLWHYTTADAHETVRKSGYFTKAGHMLRVGDMIMLNAGTGGLSPASGIMLVAANLAGAVDSSDLTPIGTANVD
jgi:hypothetical protein